jgi:hypothetical protein
MEKNRIPAWVIVVGMVLVVGVIGWVALSGAMGDKDAKEIQFEDTLNVIHGGGGK